MTKFIERLVFGQLTFIQFGFAQSQFREGAKNAPYVARINGPHAVRRFARKFMPTDSKRSNGVLEFHGVVSGLYDIKYFTVIDGPRDWRHDLFVVVTTDGVVEVPLSIAKQIAELLTMMDWRSIEPAFALVDLTDSEADLEGALLTMGPLEVEENEAPCSDDLPINPIDPSTLMTE